MKHGDTGKCTLWINFHYGMTEYGPTALSWKCYNLHTDNSLTPSGCLQNTNTLGIFFRGIAAPFNVFVLLLF